MKLNDIIIIDDDADDCELFQIAFNNLKIANNVVFLNSSSKALSYLRQIKQQPFFIICDVNMPELSGLELRQKINADKTLNVKAIPFLFCSTSGSEQLVNQAYALNIQGFFVKPHSITELSHILYIIMQYWSISNHPYC